MRVDNNSIQVWLPRLEAAGLPVPRTKLVQAETDLSTLLDGREPDGWREFLELLEEAVDEIGLPCFLRTEHGSGKHYWDDTCFLRDKKRLGYHVFSLVEWSHTVDLFGLSHEVWAVRELIPTTPLFRCSGYGNFPVTREFRLFVREDDIEHVQPYWPPGAVEEGDPDSEDWREKLASASVLRLAEREHLAALARRAGAALGGFWSLDFLQASDGEWWLTDAAEGDRSFRWEGV